MTDTHNSREAGQARYDAYWARQMADPEFRHIYEEEAAKKGLWLQLVEARQAAGLTQEQMAQRLGVSQSQVAKIERRGYEAYTLTTLHRYVQALGADFALRGAGPPRPARRGGRRTLTHPPLSTYEPACCCASGLFSYSATAPRSPGAGCRNC